jgi:hypothetical protein
LPFSLLVDSGHFSALDYRQLREAVAQAKVHLFASIDPSAAGQVAIVGPRLELAKELLTHGEKQAVLKYLKECARLCAKHHAQFAYTKLLGESQYNYARLAAQLERGETPDFDC